MNRTRIRRRAPGPSSAGGYFDPGTVTVSPRRVGLGGVWSATLVVTGLPREVAGAGWLAPLSGHPGLLDVSLHITPVDPVTAAGRLRRQLARLESGRRANSVHGRLPDPDVDAAAEDAQLLADRVARGETRLFTTTLTVTVSATTEAALDDELAAVRALLSSLLMTAHPASWRAWHGWQTGLPLGVDRISTDRILDTTALAAAFPFASPDLPSPDPRSSDPGPSDVDSGARPDGGAGPGGVLYGHNLASASLVFWDRWAADNYNSVILGRSGAGKSYLAKLELLRSLYTGVAAHVIDPEDEYSRLAAAVGATVIRLGDPAVRINPLDLDIHTHPDGRATAAPDALTRRRLSLHTFLALALTTAASSAGPTGAEGGDLSSSERAVLDEAITATYARAGISDDPATWTRPAPLLRDLHHTLLTASASATSTLNAAGFDDGGGVEPGRITQILDPDRASSNSPDTPEGDRDTGDADPEDGNEAAGRDAALKKSPSPSPSAAPADSELGMGRDVAVDLARRLRPYVDGAFSGLFDGPTTHPPGGRHLVVWSLRELPDQLRGLATMLVLDTIWRTVTHPHDRRRRMVLVDEAWLLLQHPAGARFLLRAAKAGRKHWCGLTIATQDTADVLASDLGRAVIANSATQILLRQAPQAIDQVVEVFALSSGERAFLLTAERGEGLLTGGQCRAAFAALASPGEDDLITTDPAQLADRSTTPEWITLTPPGVPGAPGRVPAADELGVRGSVW